MVSSTSDLHHCKLEPKYWLQSPPNALNLLRTPIQSGSFGVGGDDTVGDSVGDDERVTVGGDDTVGGNVLAIRGSKHSPHSEHTSLA